MNDGLTGWGRDWSDGVSEIMNASEIGPMTALVDGVQSREHCHSERESWMLRRSRLVWAGADCQLYLLCTYDDTSTLHGREWANSLPDHCVSSSH